MGEDIFNFVLSDISGVPSLPVFIGNYLLDLLSAFFPIFLILSSFVMVYTAFARGSGDWKATGQQLMPTAVSIGIIMGLLSMKTPYTSSDGGGLEGEFWKDVNSYTVVEMMNTFLGFGNIFADALTHKIIYGSIDVSERYGDNNFDGYFPAVLKAMMDKESREKEDLINSLNRNSNTSNFHRAVSDNYSFISSNTKKMINNLYYLGIIDNHGKIREGVENQVSSYSHLKGKSYIENDEKGKSSTDAAIFKYKTPAIVNGTTGGTGVVEASTSGSIEDKFYDKKTIFLNHDTLLATPPTNGSEALIGYLDNFKNQDIISITTTPTETEIYSYLSKHNFQQEGLMILNLDNLIQIYGSLYEAFDKEALVVKGEIEASTKPQDKMTLLKRAEDYNEYKLALSGQIQKTARLYKDFIELYGNYSGQAVSTSNVATALNKIGINFDKDIKKDVEISVEEKDILNKSYNEAINGEVPIKTKGDNSYRVNSVNQNLNAIMKSKAYITNVFFDKYKDILKDDSLLQYSFGFDPTTPFNLNFLNENKVMAVKVLMDKKYEIQEKYRDELGNINVAAKLKEAIQKEQAGSGLTQGKIIHWTDLGKHYATFKNIYSPLVTNIYAMEKMNSADIEGAASLIQMMEELEPSKKTERLLFVANTFAAGKMVLGASETLKSKVDPSTKKPGGGSFTSFWEAIKIIGGVYFAIFFVNVVLPAFVWMFAVITYYIEMSMYVAVFPIGFMFMIFQSYRQSLNQYINMLLGFILMPIILVSMYFVVLYIDMLMPMFFKQFMPFFASNHEFSNSFNTAFGGQGTWLKDLMGSIVEGAGSFINQSALNDAKAAALSNGGSVSGVVETDLMNSIGSFIYTILSLLMSALLLMTFFRANEYMSKILNVSTVGGMDAFQGRETIGKFGSFDRSGMTAGIIGR